MYTHFLNLPENSQKNMNRNHYSRGRSCVSNHFQGKSTHMILFPPDWSNHTDLIGKFSRLWPLAKPGSPTLGG